jgi:hypothetical protein
MVIWGTPDVIVIGAKTYLASYLTTYHFPFLHLSLPLDSRRQAHKIPHKLEKSIDLFVSFARSSISRQADHLNNIGYLGDDTICRDTVI